MNVSVTGSLDHVDQTSCSNPGTVTNLGGYANKYGIFQCPVCEVNAVWNILINFNTVTGSCTPNLQPVSIDFPCGAAIQPFTCVL
jgi:hypothetical protein